MPYLMIDIDGLELSAEDIDMLAHPAVVGVILFARNYQSPQQLISLTANIKACDPTLLVAVDQEGGRVQRFVEGFTRLPALYELGKLYRRQPQLAQYQAAICAFVMASELIAAGVDFSFAPVLDLYRCDNPVIAERAFSDDANTVIELAKIYIAGLHDAGMIACAKHFPGHGSVTVDSHKTVVYDQRPQDTIFDTDLMPFARLSQQLDAVMPAHVIYPQCAEDSAGFSSYWLQEVLRQHCQFKGVIISDDLSMQGAKQNPDHYQRVSKAFAAGCQLALLCNDRPAVASVLGQWQFAEDEALKQSLLNFKASKDYDWVSLHASKQWRAQARAVSQLCVEQAVNG